MDAAKQASDREKISALIELSSRAKGGIFMYLAMWLIITLVSDIHINHPGFVFFNALLMSVNISLRLWQLMGLKQLRADNLHQSEQFFTATSLFNALHWSALTAYIILTPAYDIIAVPMLLTTTGIIAGGTMARV